MALRLKAKASIAGLLASDLDLGLLSYVLDEAGTVQFRGGKGAGLADTLFVDRRTVAASTSDDIDIAGSLKDPFNALLSFDRVKLLLIAAPLTNPSPIIVGGAPASPFQGPFGATSDKVEVRPGGVIMFACQDATGWPVIADLSDRLRVANPGGDGPADYLIILLGEGGGGGADVYTPSLDFSERRNSQYVAAVAA